MRGIYERQSKVKGLDELEICMAKFKDVDLKNGSQLELKSQGKEFIPVVGRKNR